MLVAAAFCPAAPVLVAPLAQAAASELDGLRTACRAAIRAVAGPDRRLVLVGSGPTSRAYGPSARGSFAGFGLPLEVGLGPDPDGPPELPAALSVGAWLLHDALGDGVAARAYAVADATDAELTGWDGTADEQVAAVLLGEGSARRTVKAPGYLDPRAEPFDAAVADAIASGDPHRLLGFADSGTELLQTGAAVWELAGHALAGRAWDAELRYAEAPYGVGYVVASWTPR